MNKISRRLFLWGGLAALAASGGYGLNIWRKFGAIPQVAPNSPNWHDGSFHNLPDNYLYAGLKNEPLHAGGWLKFFLSRGDGRYPPEPVPAQKIDLHDLKDGEFVWLGHSSYLCRLAGKLICIDPVLASRASPAPFTIPAWPGSRPYAAQDFPFIDYLCISHDHWDHLDYEAVTSLNYGQILCGKGVGAHFASWGLPPAREFDWHDRWQAGPLQFVFTPSRHFSGRGFTRNQSLWGGFCVSSGSGGSFYFTGDGGYGSHFRDIGKNYGPFEMVFPDSGQYNRAWPTVHMFPEQAVLAVQDARGKTGSPAHIGKFTLSWHPWNEPAARFSKKARQTGTSFILPVIGQRCSLDGKLL